mgnify:CR=1 FL=1
MRAGNITLLLVIIGGLNWGLVGFFDFDLVSAIFGDGAAETATSSSISGIVYVVVALSAVWQIRDGASSFGGPYCRLSLMTDEEPVHLEGRFWSA